MSSTTGHMIMRNKNDSDLHRLVQGVY